LLIVTRENAVLKCRSFNKAKIFLKAITQINTIKLSIKMKHHDSRNY